jgi:hypothetical protein
VFRWPWLKLHLMLVYLPTSRGFVGVILNNLSTLLAVDMGRDGECVILSAGFNFWSIWLVVPSLPYVVGWVARMLAFWRGITCNRLANGLNGVVQWWSVVLDCMYERSGPK